MSRMHWRKGSDEPTGAAKWVHPQPISTPIRDALPSARASDRNDFRETLLDMTET